MPATTMEVIVFSKHDCHLCHVALRIARHVQADTPFTLRAIDISDDVALVERYGTRVPVIFIDQKERLFGKMTERALRTELKRARWRRSISRILSRFGWFPNR